MTVNILLGDCRQRLAELPSESVHTCVTSPPYFGLRDYGVDGQIGLEMTPDAFVAELVAVFREVLRVLRDDGTLWLNLGDSYAGSRCGPQGLLGEMADRSVASQRMAREQAGNYAARPGAKPKDLLGIPWMVAFALRADGWFLRQDIIWSKPNPMPESVRDRCTKAHEYLFLLSKSERYFYDAVSIREDASGTAHARRAKDGAVRVTQKTVAATAGVKNNASMSAAISGEVLPYRNKRSVWTVGTEAFKEAHFATYPPELIEPCILAGAPKGGCVLDPFGGAGTTGLVADRLGRDAVLVELNPAYAEIARKRIAGEQGMFSACEVRAA